MIILIDKNKNDLVVNIDNMATSPDNKHKKHAGSPYPVRRKTPSFMAEI